MLVVVVLLFELLSVPIKAMVFWPSVKVICFDHDEPFIVAACPLTVTDLTPLGSLTVPVTVMACVLMVSPSEGEDIVKAGPVWSVAVGL